MAKISVIPLVIVIVVLATAHLPEYCRSQHSRVQVYIGDHVV